MKTGTDSNRCGREAAKRPYALLGAGRLTSSIWKEGDEGAGWRYRFNIFRMTPAEGRVSQLLRPGDLHDLVKLCHVLAAVLADDGCLPTAERRALAVLVERLEPITNQQR